MWIFDQDGDLFNLDRASLIFVRKQQSGLYHLEADGGEVLGYKLFTGTKKEMCEKRRQIASLLQPTDLSEVEVN